ncbi:MAG TPA: tetratricopeptide repeat protein, partial [Candidatus Rifleibacterium sp.]|nr:tetratricopeptide repeat protein [Candidatus Rifleibacterium sp.]
MTLLKLKLKLARTFLFLTFLLSASVSLFSQSFDKNLDEVSRLSGSGKHADLLARLQGLKASAELSDLRLFLEAEALKNLGRKAEALALYERIISQFPDGEPAFQSQMPRFMLQLETVTDMNAAIRHEKAASALATPWQRGTAMVKLSELPFLNLAGKSRFALNAIRQFRSDSPFYRQAPAGHDLLKKILQNPEQYQFVDEEWIEILLVASYEGLIGEFFKKPHNYAALLGRFGSQAAEVFKADNLRQQKKLPQAMEIFNAVIAGRKASAETLSLAYQLRGDAHHFAENHSSAAADYHEVLKFKRFPANLIAAEYRLMRSAFKIGRDAEALEIMGRLAKQPAVGPL